VLSKIAAIANLGVGVIWLLGMSWMWLILGGMAGLFSSMHAFLRSLPYLFLFFAGPLLLISGSVMFLVGRKHLVSLALVAVSSVGLIGMTGKTLYDAAHPVPLQAPTGYGFYALFGGSLVITGAATLILLLNFIQDGKRAEIESGSGA
jgi:hypothetical protein